MRWIRELQGEVIVYVNVRHFEENSLSSKQLEKRIGHEVYKFYEAKSGHTRRESCERMSIAPYSIKQNTSVL